MLTIVMTNIVMAERTGTEVATYELSLELHKRGHRVFVYSPTLGRLASDLSNRGVPVVDDISQINIIPDVIHGNHNVALATAMIRFRESPAIFVCHDAASPFDKPFLSPRITKYVAVDYACRERLIACGVDDHKIEDVINAVDLAAYHEREIFSPTPNKALAIIKEFQNKNLKERYISTLIECCKIKNISIELVGRGVNNEIAYLSSLIYDFDICFSYSRSAIESCCAGAQVIITDEFSYGGVLDASLVKTWPKNHLGRRVSLGVVDKKNILAGIDSYDVSVVRDAMIACRELTNLSTLVLTWERIYNDSISNFHKSSFDSVSDDKNLSYFISGFLPRALMEIREVNSARFDGQHLIRQNNIDYLISHEMNNFLISPENTLCGIILGDGWSHIEDWGVWSCADTAILNLPVQLLKKQGNTLHLFCKHYFPSSTQGFKNATVIANIGGKKISSIVFHRDNEKSILGLWKRIVIPRNYLNDDYQLIKLRLEIKSAMTPALFDGTTDNRSLGIGIISLKLTPQRKKKSVLKEDVSS